MGRARLRLELLHSEKARRKTYETRKKGLEKKASQLSTLCGVDACMIMYPPALKNEEIEPFVWSNNPDQIANLIESHKLSRSLCEESRSRTYNLASFYEDQTRKVQEEIKKVKKTIRGVKYPRWDERFDSLSGEELRMFAGVLTAKVESTKETINLLKERKIEITESSSLIMNPRIDENPDSSIGGMLGRRLEKHPLPTYFDAQSYLEDQRRMMMMMINNGASLGGNNPYNHNVINSVPLMSYDVQNVASYGQELMISDYYIPQMHSALHPNMGF